MDYILLEGHNVTYDDHSILIPENNQFKLNFKFKSFNLLIKRDTPELNIKIYTHPLERFQNNISYCNVYFCIMRKLVLLTISCFYENPENTISLESENASSAY